MYQVENRRQTKCMKIEVLFPKLMVTFCRILPETKGREARVGVGWRIKRTGNCGSSSPLWTDGRCITKQSPCLHLASSLQSRPHHDHQKQQTKLEVASGLMELRDDDVILCVRAREII